jgi:hypothetical protein
VLVGPGDVLGEPVGVHSLVLCTKHGPKWNSRRPELKATVVEHILKPALGRQWHDDITVHVNATGSSIPAARRRAAA